MGPSLDERGRGRFLAALGRGRALWEAMDPTVLPARQTLAFAQACHDDPPLRNALGLPLRVIEHVPRAAHYEAMLLFRGEVAFRPGSAHDWLNLLSWQVWPLGKAALNLRHALHYLARLRRERGPAFFEHVGARVDRDEWMQNLANLDEGGGVATRAFLAAHTRLDTRLVRHVAAPVAALEAGFHWFGHAALELLFHGRPAPRMWIAIVDELGDEALARRVLTLHPALEAEVAPLLHGLGALAPFYRDALRFAEDDPFLKPFQSMWPPWAGAPEERPG